MHRITIFLILFISAYSSSAQRPEMQGKLYGKVIDAGTSRGVEFATIRLFNERTDSITGKVTPNLVTGVITRPNGEFILEGVGMGHDYKLIISAIGYREYNTKISYPKPPPGSMPVMEKDLGNIRLSMDTVSLGVVEIEGSGPAVRFEADKKVFDVQDNAVSAGGTGADVLNNLPSVSVDIDGNVSLRNQSPQIFVDGRLTTLTIDQIPAEAIESVEIITNPSAKYDASGGGGGIINIILKKEKKLGYHGNLRAGVDMFGRINAGGDVNVREGKFNVFLSGMYNQRQSVGNTTTTRTDFYTSPVLEHYQFGEHETKRVFMFGRGGVDYFINNRSTLTLSHTTHRGQFDPFETLRTETDTIYPDGTIVTGGLDRVSETNRSFHSNSSSILFKHLFPKEGREFTADATYNFSGGGGGGEFTTYYDNNPLVVRQKQEGKGVNNLLVTQADYVTPTAKGKIETGVRAAVRRFTSTNVSYIFNPVSDAFEELTSLTANYAYTDQVYAGYLTYSRKFGKKAGMQVGLRAESSFYEGELLTTGEKFSNQYPISLFPSGSGFLKLSEKSDLQVSYTRRVNRPNFFSLMPFTDYSDSLNIKRGNPALTPEFTHIAELSYLKRYTKENSFMATGFFRQVNGLFSNFQYLDTNPVTGKEAVINSYRNEGSAYGYGLELTSRTVTKKKLDITANFAVYNAVIPGSISNLDNTWAWYGELNLSLKLPKDFFFQTSAEYESKTVYQIDSNRGEHGWGSQASANSQGYTYPEYEFDVAVRKDFLKKKLTATLSVSDVFKTDINGTYSKTDFFEQETIRKRNQQYIRFSLSYRFGKFDQSLFRRKNTRNTMDQDGGF